MLNIQSFCLKKNLSHLLCNSCPLLYIANQDVNTLNITGCHTAANGRNGLPDLHFLAPILTITSGLPITQRQMTRMTKLKYRIA